MGVDVERASDAQLTTAFAAQPVPFTEQQVLDLARRHNPTVQALRSREHVSDVNVKVARSQYTPTLSLSTGIGGYSYQYANDDFLVQQAQARALGEATQCATMDSLRRGASLPGLSCSTGILTPQQLSAARAANGYDLVQSPKSVRATLSLPIFDGFSREQRVQEAQAARADARYSVRAQELALSANVSAAFRTLTTAQRTVELQATNAAAAREALSLAEERFRVGANTFVDVSQARADFERAETDRINAIYDYHRAYAALQSAVGRPLR
jgi:outer membrane protein